MGIGPRASRRLAAERWPISPWVGILWDGQDGPLGVGFGRGVVAADTIFVCSDLGQKEICRQTVNRQRHLSLAKISKFSGLMDQDGSTFVAEICI